MSFYRYFWYLKTAILGPREVLEKSLNFFLSVCYEHYVQVTTRTGSRWAD